MSQKIVSTKSYTIADFLKWNSDDELDLSPKYQRSNVWNDNAKSYFIDSILKGMPIPPVFIRQVTNVNLAKVFKEVIDGQQRLRTIIDFYSDRVDLLPLHSSAREKQKYSMLSDEDKEAFFSYDIPVQIVKTNEEGKIYDMFSRLNSNNYTLNKQELRNAKYWGDFKSIVYALTSEKRQFFIDARVFTDRHFSRMKDAELVGQLLINVIAGVVDGKDSTLDRFYKEYDAQPQACFEASLEFINRFSVCQNIIQGGEFSHFNRPPYFYTLFAAMNNINGQLVGGLIDKLQFLESKISDLNDKIDIGDDFYWLSTFIANHKQRTTDRNERIQRVGDLTRYLQ